MKFGIRRGQASSSDLGTPEKKDTPSTKESSTKTIKHTEPEHSKDVTDYPDEPEGRIFLHSRGAKTPQ